ncbi:unnamed protein product [Meloidogyne enterolobii]|uniref:Uncharacterized protein n=1 Tax=Meloidogyne enterolobii TaxID=390850 RepID=A0ACB0ZDP7_MELEN
MPPDSALILLICTCLYFSSFFFIFFLDSLHLDFLYCFYIYTTLFLPSIICLAFFPSSCLFPFILFLYPFSSSITQIIAPYNFYILVVGIYI